jgi:peptidyl-prolyl cis-trans isomerase A (cyclophilin A)
MGALATPLFLGRWVQQSCRPRAGAATYKANFDTSKGLIVTEVNRDWAPNGADRFYNLVKNGFYDDARFFRVISGFMVQFGIHADQKLSAVWRSATIPEIRSSRATSAATSPTQPGAELAHEPGVHQFCRQWPARPQGFSCSASDGRDDGRLTLFSGYGGALRAVGAQGRIQTEGNAISQRTS